MQEKPTTAVPYNGPHKKIKLDPSDKFIRGFTYVLVSLFSVLRVAFLADHCFVVRLRDLHSPLGVYALAFGLLYVRLWSSVSES